MANSNAKGRRVYVTNASEVSGSGGLTDAELRATPIPVDIGATDINAINTGAANLAITRLVTSTTAATLVVARPTRASVLIRNLDTAITVYIGPATVTSANGFPLLPGESAPFTWVGLIQVIAASGTPAVAAADEYN